MELFEYSFDKLTRCTGADIVLTAKLYTIGTFAIRQSSVDHFGMDIHIPLYLVDRIADDESGFGVGILDREPHITLFHHYFGMSVKNHKFSFK